MKEIAPPAVETVAGPSLVCASKATEFPAWVFWRLAAATMRFAVAVFPTKSRLGMAWLSAALNVIVPVPVLWPIVVGRPMAIALMSVPVMPRLLALGPFQVIGCDAVSVRIARLPVVALKEPTPPFRVRVLSQVKVSAFAPMLVAPSVTLEPLSSRAAAVCVIVDPDEVNETVPAVALKVAAATVAPPLPPAKLKPPAVAVTLLPIESAFAAAEVVVAERPELNVEALVGKEIVATSLRLTWPVFAVAAPVTPDVVIVPAPLATKVNPTARIFVKAALEIVSPPAAVPMLIFVPAVALMVKETAPASIP